MQGVNIPLISLRRRQVVSQENGLTEVPPFVVTVKNPDPHCSVAEVSFLLGHDVGAYLE